MERPSYQSLIPRESESKEIYAKRLEDDGHEEMFIRKALGHHFRMQLDAFGEFFEPFEKARLRHIDSLLEIDPNRTDYSLARKVSKDLGISMERGEHWVKLYRAKNLAR